MWLRIKRHMGIALSCAGILCLIIYRKIVYEATAEGLALCLQTIIPTLLPYMFLSGILSGSLVGVRIPSLRFISRLCRIPAGTESLFLLGLVSGYPVGAKLVADAYASHHLDRNTAQRMLPFCNNAGPSFIIGFLAPLFGHPLIPLLLWMIHIISALITGVLMPGGKQSVQGVKQAMPIGASAILLNTLKSLAGICGWVILFRILLTLADKWFVHKLPALLQTCLTGLLELVNGCISLSDIPDDATKFILCACLLALGGLCVYMQTVSVVKGLGLGLYLPGKIMQLLVSLQLSIPISGLFGTVDRWFWLVWGCSLPGIIAIRFILKKVETKKVVAIS